MDALVTPWSGAAPWRPLRPAYLDRVVPPPWGPVTPSQLPAVPPPRDADSGGETSYADGVRDARW